MATITATDMKVVGAKAITETTLNGSSDTFSYIAAREPILVFRNPTGSPITPTIDGDGASTVEVEGVGDVDISSGYSVGSIAAGDSVAIDLSTIEEYLRGTIAINSGSGLVGQLLEF